MERKTVHWIYERLKTNDKKYVCEYNRIRWNSLYVLFIVVLKKKKSFGEY